MKLDKNVFCLQKGGGGGFCPPPPSCGPGVPLIIDLMSYPVNNHLPSYSNMYVQRNGSDEEYFSLVELLRILVVFFSSLVQLVEHCS